MHWIARSIPLFLITLCLPVLLFVPPALSQSMKLELNIASVDVSETKSAMAAYFNQEYSDAQQRFEAIIKEWPDFASAYIYLADALFYQGRTEEAQENYLKAHEILTRKLDLRKQTLPDLQNAAIYSDIIYCLNALGRYGEAKSIGMWGTAEGDSPDMYINLGYTFHKLGKDRTAQRNFCKYKKLTGTVCNNNLYYQRINKLFEQGNLDLSCPDEIKTASGKNYALLIGVGRYRDPAVNTLRYVQNDVRELYNVLTDSKTGTFKPENIMTLINEEATEKNIKFKFDDMALKATGKDDLIMIFYAGHGFSYPNGKDTYWLTYDTVVGNKNGSRIKSTAFSNLTLASKILDIKAGKFVFFIDACFSNGMVEKQTAVRGLDSYMGLGKDYTIITSSKSDQLSMESARFKHGLFSYALINGLSGNADTNQDGWVEIDELWPYMKSDITENASQMGGTQNPVRSGSSGGLITISKNPNF